MKSKSISSKNNVHSKTKKNRKSRIRIYSSFLANVAKSKQATRKKMISIEYFRDKTFQPSLSAIIFDPRAEAGDQILNVQGLSAMKFCLKGEFKWLKGDKIVLFFKRILELLQLFYRKY
jgi:hypothetical protein